MISLAIPWALLLLVLIIDILLLKKKWWLSSLLIIIFVLMNYWSSCFCIGFKNAYSGDFKVLSFNMNGGGEFYQNKVDFIIDIIQEEDPDVVFLTENFVPLCDSLHDILHNIFPFDTRYIKSNVIYSRYPLNNPIYYSRLYNGSSYLVKCNVFIKDKELDLFGCHLSSNNYSREFDRLTPDKVNKLSDIKTYLSNITNASRLREKEADSIIKQCIGKDCVIVMGDMNDVCGSPSMQKFKKARFKDAWSIGGVGYGATIHYPLPYRIDHVMYNDGLALKGIKKIKAHGISDHDVLVAVFVFK